MGPTGKIVSVVAGLDIGAVKQDPEGYMETAFSAAEKEYLTTRHIRTTAGWLAVKRAIVMILKDEKGLDISPGQIALDCLADGRPVVRSIDSSSGLSENLFISISHTRTTALGLAVLQVT